VVLKLANHLAPIKVAFLPLMKKPELEEVSRKIFKNIGSLYKAEYDNAGTIGKRYRRQDEVGTPYCVTIDYDTLKDQTVTVRHRDSMNQERIGLDNLPRFFADKFNF
jgi:glycyl-tRNA synthetase